MPQKKIADHLLAKNKRASAKKWRNKNKSHIAKYNSNYYFGVIKPKRQAMKIKKEKVK